MVSLLIGRYGIKKLHRGTITLKLLPALAARQKDLDHLPDSKFLPPMEMNCVEKELKKSMHDKFGRLLTIGRVAHVTSPSSTQQQCATWPMPVSATFVAADALMGILQQ
jgi:hypothetical protein